MSARVGSNGMVVEWVEWGEIANASGVRIVG